MRKQIIRQIFAALVFAIITMSANAQIVLHEATDITQTKATLSADFPDLNSEHGFQYKYGTLPEIDEFSKVALSQHSDPVQLKANNWKSRSVKGFVENISGQNGTITATLTLYKAATISFDWSIDAQEGCAYLRFCKEAGVGSSYIEVDRITGTQPFSTYSIQLSEGIHHLQWEYCQISPSSVGLDIAQIKNITIENSLPGEWKYISTPTPVATLDNLIPHSEVLYRAFENGTGSLSRIGTFKTDSTEILPYQLSGLTQTTATITRSVGSTEAPLQKGANYMYIHPLLANLVSDRTDCSGMKISADNKWKGNNGRVEYTVTNESGFSYGTLILTLTVTGEKYAKSKVEFDVTNEGTYHSGCYFGLFIDDEKNVNQTFKKGSGHYSVELMSGKHTLTFKASRWNSNAAGGTVSISNLFGENIASAETFNTLYTTTDDVKIESLKPDNFYMAQSFVLPENSSNEPQAWQGIKSTWFRIKTLPVIISADTCAVTQSSFTIKGIIDKGDATTNSVGYQYRAVNGVWITTSTDNNEAIFSHKINRLKPGNEYECRVYALPAGCDSVFSDTIRFSTLNVIAQKPILTKLSQHEATLQGTVIFGDATIYQRGMQFRKVGSADWEDLEDGGDNPMYTLIKKNLEMGATYQARTYVQPAGCEILYSDILEFTTLDSYFTKCNSNDRTQTTITLEATLADVDEGIMVDAFGFEYYIYSDGFFEDSFIQSDVIDVPVTPNDKHLKTIITGLTPQLGIMWRAYAIIDGNKNYTSHKDWDFAITDRATIVATVKNITQTSISLELDATQEGDAIVSQIEYAFANSVQDTKEYQVCGNELTINNLSPNTKYNLRFRGTVNGRLCPLLFDTDWECSWFEFTTKDVTISTSFTGITQTKATMNVTVDSGDAEVTDLKYRLDYGEYMDCGTTVNFKDLAPHTQYTVSFTGKVNGMDYYWTTQPNSTDVYKFTTMSVMVCDNRSSASQTAAVIQWYPIYGDATFVSSGIEYGQTTAMTEVLAVNDDESEVSLTELTPSTTYYYRVYLETAEGGKVYSSSDSFMTSAIICTTLPVNNISNRSATMNGMIDCDDYSSAEFGFQWKQMEGWNSDPAFTKGVKNEDGSISVALVNGMLEPNTDYQYRAAVRYKGNIYCANSWETFRTESEFVYYPASVYTIFRTDRENNCLILCGYYVAGSETVTTQGYEYWNTSTPAYAGRSYAAGNNVVTITTDESMQHTLDLKALKDGNYSVRAFVTTSSGTTIYGETLSFGVQGGNVAGIGNVESKAVKYSISGNILSIYNASALSCTIYNLRGTIIEHRQSMTDTEEFNFIPDAMYIVRLSNGLTYKIRM